VAAHAKREAAALKGDRGKFPDAIAYYRIAATAYWRSGKPEVINDLFEVTDNGAKLCADLGENAPDRDCLFLQLVIPFAGLESNVKNTGLSDSVKGVNFNDGDASPDEIATMRRIGETLVQVKPLIQNIFAVGRDNRYLSHPGMREYYCENAKKAFDYYERTAGIFLTKVDEFYRKFPGNAPGLGITMDEARGIRDLKGGPPVFVSKGSISPQNIMACSSARCGCQSVHLPPRREPFGNRRYHFSQGCPACHGRVH